MPVTRPQVEAALARVNAQRPRDLPARLEAFEGGARFRVSFPDRAMPEGQCIDQDFTDIQWDLHEREKVTTGIVGGRHDPDEGRYHIDYEVVEWD